MPPKRNALRWSHSMLTEPLATVVVVVEERRVEPPAAEVDRVGATDR